MKLNLLLFFLVYCLLIFSCGEPKGPIHSGELDSLKKVGEAHRLQVHTPAPIESTPSINQRTKFIQLYYVELGCTENGNVLFGLRSDDTVNGDWKVHNISLPLVGPPSTGEPLKLLTCTGDDIPSSVDENVGSFSFNSNVLSWGFIPYVPGEAFMTLEVSPQTAERIRDIGGLAEIGNIDG